MSLLCQSFRFFGYGLEFDFLLLSSSKKNREGIKQVNKLYESE